VDGRVNPRCTLLGAIRQRQALILCGSVIAIVDGYLLCKVWSFFTEELCCDRVNGLVGIGRDINKRDGSY
jgi:hypothetical protein